MSAIIRPNQAVLYMKIGVHAREPLESIIQRKRKEIEDEGFAMWGYGGNTCHPTSMVQPFAKSVQETGQKIYLCMKRMTSNHFADPIRAEEYSVDGVKWQRVPKGIHVLGSRYALAIKELREENFDLRLDQSRVALGRSEGAVGGNYVAGRVDKACLKLTDGVQAPAELGERIEPISLVAELCEPFAVFLRN